MRKRQYMRFMVSMALVLTFVLVSMKGHACTGIQLKTEDGHFIFARTLEFSAEQMPFNLIVVPRNYPCQGQTASGKPGMSWKTTYAYVGFNPFGAPLVADGLNEKGLACGSFLFPGCAEFEALTGDMHSRAISSLDLTSWILSTCATVSEVREKLPKIVVFSIKMPELGPIMDLHYFVTDETGDAAVIEYVGGKLNIYDNEVNAITNCPVYHWHISNQQNYIGLKAFNNPPSTIGNKTFAQFGQGSGAIGLPGDFTPPSRFVRAAFLANAAYEGKNVDEGICIAFHILNQFDIPKGSIREKHLGHVISDSTQWTSASDLKNRRYYFHTYHDRSVKMIDLNELDLNAQNIKGIRNIQKPAQVINLSNQINNTVFNANSMEQIIQLQKQKNGSKKER